MSARFDANVRDPLVVRLESLEFDVPIFADVAAGARSARRPARRRRVIRRSSAGLALALGAVLATTVAAFPSALSTLTADVLKAAGLSSSQVAPVIGEARHGSASLSVSGAYADELNTVVFVALDANFQTCDQVSSVDTAKGNCGYAFRGGTGTTEAAAPYLTDQFGQTYRIISGGGIGVGPYPMFFEPVRGPAKAAGARLTVHVPMVRVPYTTTKGQTAKSGDEFDLSVSLSGSLAPSAAKAIALPKPIVDAKTHVTYEVVDLRSSGPYLIVHTRISGDLRNVIQEMDAGQIWPGVYLVDSRGSYQIPVSGSPGPVASEQLQDEARIFSVSSTGTYRIVVSQTSASNHNQVPGGPGSVTLAEWSVNVK